MKSVTVLIGSGSIGVAIARRVSAGKHILLADLKKEYGFQELLDDSLLLRLQSLSTSEFYLGVGQNFHGFLCPTPHELNEPWENLL